MPSENKTPNYGLNQWRGNEYPKREDFNADNAKIDTALCELEAHAGLHPRIIVTVESGSTVTAICGDKTVTGVSDGTCILDIPSYGTWTINATLEEQQSTTTIAIDTVKQYGIELQYITLTVTAPTGSTVTATNGGAVITGEESPTGTWIFGIPNLGGWTIKATLSGKETSTIVTIDTVKQYEVTLRYTAIYGVEKDWSNSSTQLIRLDKSQNFPDPTPAIGTGSGSSPFDNLYPWSEMDEYNIINNAVSHKKGDVGFSSTAYDVVVKIPKFWYKTEKVGTKQRWWIADGAAEGFKLHPAFTPGGVEKDCIYVSRYHCGASDYMSRSGVSPQINMTRATARTAIHNKGSHFWQDYAVIRSAIQLLYLVEFADFDSQVTIGKGYTDDNSAAIANGGTDDMTYHTGRHSGIDGKTAVQYRHIENLWGNVYSWLDGYNECNNTVYLCNNPPDFADDTSSNYYTYSGNSGVAWGESYAAELVDTDNDDWLFANGKTGGSTSTYIPDYLHFYVNGSNWYLPYCGGCWCNGAGAGLWYFGGNYGSTIADSSIGARLLYIP